MTRRTAHVSVDLDPIDTHLAGYGIGRPPCNLIYKTSVPRMLDLLDSVGMQATFFVVARDAEPQAELWREVVERGHEISSHSLTHRLPLTGLPREELDNELEESRERLMRVIGRPVLGFRAPGWDMDHRTIEAVAMAGYAYDASILPSPGLLMARLLKIILSRGAMWDLSLSESCRAALSRRDPHQVAANGTFLWEFPVAVSPALRIPFLHTSWYLLPHALCWRVYRAILAAAHPLCYQFHAVDLLDLETDGVDSRMARHPGMRLPLSKKLRLLEVILKKIASDYEVLTYGKVVARES